VANLSNPDSTNQLLIDKAVKNSLNKALIIPGSSIKGAMSTAIIDYLDQKYSLHLKDNRNYRNYLSRIFGRPDEENTFQDVKIGDFEAKIGEQCVVSAQEVRKQVSDKETTPKHDCEVSLSLCANKQDAFLYNAITCGRLFGDEHPKVLRIQGEDINEKLTLQNVFEICNRFYGMRYLKEKNEFYKKGHLKDAAQALAPIDRIIQNLGSEEMILRLGHYSHVECVTIRNSQPHRRRINGRLLPTGTTRTLAHGLYPFGWVKLRLCSWEELHQAQREKEEHDRTFLKRREEIRTHKKKQRIELARKKQEQETRRQKEEEFKRQREQELAAMPYEERQIFLVEQKEADENQIFELFFNLDNLEKEMKIRAAKAIKAVWKEQKKRWRGKLTPKQAQKVSKVKEILNED
jgi:CRISPR/Cas system CSM-associated protein Csm5 (group 7 of RAMP superfamily)